MKNDLENKILDEDEIDVGNKLTVEQLADIKRYLPRHFAKKTAEKYAGVTKRQVVEVFNQRSPNPVWNQIVWDAIKKKLAENERKDLIEAIDKRLLFCNSLLDM